ncbi:MAG: glutamate--tRNA ligase [Bdellovibrionales bacterium]|nr:glutamate--tRNA ligase [Bdellovibrionales bacterium]
MRYSVSSNAQVRVRFAPSPTGWLHIGGVRTTLFNYLFARKHGGKFLLRIEDTDTERSEQKYTDDILSSLKWLGMEPEEPILYQSKRFDLYKKVADDMVSKGQAYRCYCTEAEVEATREQMMKEGKKPMYARTCRNLTAPPTGREHAPFAIRSKFPLTGTTSFKDMIRGEISFPNEDLDDFVIIRSNGVPTYNFVVVIDDIEMKISHVIRGDDHINNTPKQMYLYAALNHLAPPDGDAPKVPMFAHLPMILGQDKKKLSKRNGETSTNAYREQGFLPEALLNFLVRLGWSHGDQELFSMQEMIDLFNLENVQVSGAVFNTEKLMWIAGEHMKKADPTRLLKIIQTDFGKCFSGVSLPRLKEPLTIELIKHIQQKVKLVKEVAEQLHPLLEKGVMPVDSSGLKWNKDADTKQKVKNGIESLIELGRKKLLGNNSLAEAGVGHADIDGILRGICEQHGIKLGDFTGPMRLFVTGQATSAIGLFDLLPILHWSDIEERLQACLKA